MGLLDATAVQPPTTYCAATVGDGRGGVCGSGGDGERAGGTMRVNTSL
jgi:hypothetical protein